MRKIKHSNLPITLISADELDFDFLNAIQLNLMYDENRKDNRSGWEMWTDEYGEWFSPYKKNPNQLELFK